MKSSMCKESLAVIANFLFVSGLAVFVALKCPATALAEEPTAPTRVLIRAGHLLDVRSGLERAGLTIIDTGNVISAIAATSATPKGPGDRGLEGMTVMPGLIDVHTHLTMEPKFFSDPYGQLSTSVA